MQSAIERECEMPERAAKHELYSLTTDSIRIFVRMATMAQFSISTISGRLHGSSRCRQADLCSFLRERDSRPPESRTASLVLAVRSNTKIASTWPVVGLVNGSYAHTSPVHVAVCDWITVWSTPMYWNTESSPATAIVEGSFEVSVASKNF